MDNTCHLARLPFELRQRILAYALHDKGTMGLQSPTWDHGSAFKEPLFTVCRSTRSEAIEAFYKTNTFLWHIHRPQNVDAKPDSDPSVYPLEINDPNFTIAPSLPWHYPHLKRDLRHLALNIFMPSDLDPNAWLMAFPLELKALVTTLNEGGSKLKSLKLTIITGYWRNEQPLPPENLETMSILGQLNVSGKVKVRCQPSYWPCSESVYSLGLEEKIRA